MKIQEISDKQIWDSFFNSVGSTSFHQAWEWGEFQKMLHYDIVRLGIYDNQKLIAITLVIKIRSKRGKFLFIPHGPVFNIPSDKLTVTVSSNDNTTVKNILETLTNYLKELAIKEGFWFIRIAPMLADLPEHKGLFNTAGYHTAPIYINAETMWAVDISQSEEDILKDMRKNTRYLIRKGFNDAITITKKTTIDALDEFWKLYEVTFAREDFTPFPKSYISSEFEAFNANQAAVFFLGKTGPKFDLQGPSKFLAASLVLFTQSTGYYHQGASIHTEYPVTYQLQWQSMMEAKKRGCKYYNFYGIYKPGRTPKAWQGLSLFKRGFGGFQVDYLPTQDYIVSPKYYLSFCIDKYLAWKRGI